jgi:hypothetical protein
MFCSLVITSTTIGCAGGDEGADSGDGGKDDSKITTLKIDKPVMVSGATDESIWFKFKIPESPDYDRVRFRMENPDGDADLYVTFEDRPIPTQRSLADFEDRDEETTVSGSDCFFQICSDIRDGFVDPVVRYDVLDLKPGTYFAEVVGGDGYAKELDEGFADEPVKPEFRDKFNAALVVQSYTGIMLAKQSIDVKLDQPVKYWGDSWDQFAVFEIDVPAGHQTLRMTLEDSGEDWGRVGHLFARRDSAFTELNNHGQAGGGWEFDTESQVDIPATPGKLFFMLVSGTNATFGTLTLTLDP